MSDIFLYGVEEEGKFRFEKLIQIRCLVRDCKYDKPEFISLPSIINIDKLGDVMVKLYICRNHYCNYKSAINYDNIFDKQINFCQQLAIKPLKFAQGSMPYEIMVRQAENKLDKKSCCLRENVKYFNMKQLLTLLELLSQDDNLILRLVKRALIDKYMELLEIKNEIKLALSNKIDILKYLSLIQRQDQIIYSITSYMKQNIQNSRIILQPLSGKQGIFKTNQFKKIIESDNSNQQLFIEQYEQFIHII